MSQMPFKPTKQQIDCAEKTGFNIQDLDPMRMSNTMGMNRDNFNKCMEEQAIEKIDKVIDKEVAQGKFNMNYVYIGGGILITLVALKFIFGGKNIK